MRAHPAGKCVDNRTQTEYNPANVIRPRDPIRTASPGRIGREG
jgi:hypothetical protein